MTSSARQTTMGGADDDWLREIVHALRQPKSDRKKLGKDALTEHETKLNSPNKAPYIFWKTQFNVLAEEFPAEERLNKVEKYIAELNTWLKGIDELRKLKRRARVTSEDAHSIKEWLTLMCYFAYRTYNETMERFTLQGWLDPQPNDRLQRGAKADAKAVMPRLERMMIELGKVYGTLGEKPNRFSKHYHALVYDDASWSIKQNQTRQFTGLYNQPPDEFRNLLDNERELQQSREKGIPFNTSSLEGNTLIDFFKDDLNFYATSLMDRLEGLAKVSFPSDEDKTREENERDYLTGWHLYRKELNEEGMEKEIEKIGEHGPDSLAKFLSYRKEVQTFSVLMEQVFDLEERSRKKKREDFKEKNQYRVREYAECAYLHCALAYLPEEGKAWEQRLKRSSSHLPDLPPTWSSFRESTTNIRNFLSKQKTPQGRYDELVIKEKGVGFALAYMVRWLAHRTNGFYVALASNVQEGVLITNKTRRMPESSSWGEKVVLRNGSTYHQFIASSCAPKHLEQGLNRANRSFNQAGAKIGSITLNAVCFDVLQIEFDELPGELLSKEWTKLWDHGEQTGLLKIFAVMMDFFLIEDREIVENEEKQLEDSIFLPRLKKNEAYEKIMKHFGLDEGSKLPLYERTWLHGDEWGENFTMTFDSLGIEMYAIDLEDAVKVGYNQNTDKHTFSSNGGYHAQRLYRTESEDGSDDDVPAGAINALSAVGRLLAALLQKNKQSKNHKNAQKNIETLQRIMNRHQSSAKETHGGVIAGLEDEAYKVIWLSFFDWLLHWTEKDEPNKKSKKFTLNSFDEHVKAFLKTGED
ncbi:MAG: hypothetical protein CMB74_07330 [Euryarchaeota archaeon]|nr:hypothetical protein [Euryarchaeota archaeon]